MPRGTRVHRKKDRTGRINSSGPFRLGLEWTGRFGIFLSRMDSSGPVFLPVDSGATRHRHPPEELIGPDVLRMSYGCPTAVTQCVRTCVLIDETKSMYRNQSSRRTSPTGGGSFTCWTRRTRTSMNSSDSATRSCAYSNSSLARPRWRGATYRA